MMNTDTAALEAAIQARLDASTNSDRAWKILTRPGCGRYLVARRDIAAGDVIFVEKPLLVAHAMHSHVEPAMRSEMTAAALELLREPIDSPAFLLQEADLSEDADGTRAASLRAWARDVQRALLQSAPLRRADGSEVTVTEQSVQWALSVASVNVHGRCDPERGVLGLLASMMEHDCSPSTSAQIASAADGSTITLRAKRDVRVGESLSISYALEQAPVLERRRLLRLQHGFVCACKTCTAELVADGSTSSSVERDSDDWRQAWENRAWAGMDPYTGESTA